MVLAASLTLAAASAAGLFTPALAMTPVLGNVLEVGLVLALFTAVCAGEMRS
jgi:hypothetical protein